MPDTDIERWLIEALQEIEERAAVQKLKNENPWVLHLIKVLWKYPNGLARLTAVEWIQKSRAAKGLPEPKKFEETVQSAFQHHSSLYAEFAQRGGKPEDDLFYPVGDKGSGKWALHRDVAIAWLRARGLPL